MYICATFSLALILYKHFQNNWRWGWAIQLSYLMVMSTAEQSQKCTESIIVRWDFGRRWVEWKGFHRDEKKWNLTLDTSICIRLCSRAGGLLTKYMWKGRNLGRFITSAFIIELRARDVGGQLSFGIVILRTLIRFRVRSLPSCGQA